MYNHIFWLPQLGFELYSTATIITALLYGPFLGFIMGNLSQLLAYALSGKIKYYTYLGMIGWGIIGIIVGLTRNFNFNITHLGIFFVFIYDIITLPLFIMSGARITSALFHFVTHQLLSIIIFLNIRDSES